MGISELLSHPVIFDLQQRLSAGNLHRVKWWIVEALQLQPTDRVIEICCGTGNLASIVPGDYLGVDLDPRSIAWTKWKFRHDIRKRFLVADVTSLALKPKSFHKALFVNGLHHLSDDQAMAALQTVSQITREAVVIVDPALETRSPMSRLLLALDLGRYIRRLDAQLKVIQAGGLTIEYHDTVYTGFAHTRMFLCHPIR